MEPKGVSAKTMSEIDRKAQMDYGIPAIVLMENAGRSVFDVILSAIGSLGNEKVVIFCGKGNNGGDGFVVARYIANESPVRLTICMADPADVKPGPASDNYNIVRNMGIEVRSLTDILKDEGSLDDFTVSVDAVFGTGFKGELPDDHARLGGLLNASGLKRFAVDIPSGLNATTGKAAKNCLKAGKTITFGLPKQGFFVNDGPGVCGEVVIRNIGFPRALLEIVNQ